jgi:hypothetical protein
MITVNRMLRRRVVLSKGFPARKSGFKVAAPFLRQAGSAMVLRFTAACLFLMVATCLRVLSAELPKGVEQAGQAALAEFLPGLLRAPEKYGFSAGENLKDLKLGDPIPVARLDIDKLMKADQPSEASPFLGSDFAFWFPLSLDGHVRGVVTAVLSNGNWIPESYRDERMARVLDIFVRKYPSPRYHLRMVFADRLPELLIVEGLDYPNLTALSLDEKTAQGYAENPVRAEVVLESVKAMSHAQGGARLRDSE